jgi:membrane protease subunit (stomatin/prohibitin family)
MPELIEVLEFLDNTGSVMVKRVPDNGPTEIRWGAQLTIRDSQEAIFFRDGRVVDVFNPGRYKNFPVNENSAPCGMLLRPVAWNARHN